MATWIPKTFEEACRRAAGRRRYHAQKRRARDKRQLIILGVLVDLEWQSYGVGRVFADSLSVDPATIRLGSTKLGSRRLVPQSEIEKLIAKGTIAAVDNEHRVSQKTIR